ncbi:hypothetical protein MMP66_10905 [Acinetobacter dispersus]|uniref:hypothetical protein n=1 Tax=Acinetobacter dispersus TaxID=70348 RepID=UPI001F4A1EDA|nr:hypothetical protein [Acinetobacter dispersus]MCH7394778.1 hypothetical protein [Acinetobacter dispersus]
MNKNPLDVLDMHEVRKHYRARKSISKELCTLFDNRTVKEYVKLALGISNTLGNYSASDHDLGPKILASSSISSVFELAQKLQISTDSKSMLSNIYSANISNLKVSVGSEMVMFLKPDLFWVANTRTVWAHLLVKHGFNYSIANEELALYREQDSSSEMEYRKWREIYSLMKPNMIKLAELGDEKANRHQIKRGKIRSLWFDAISNALYEQR